MHGRTRWQGAEKVSQVDCGSRLAPPQVCRPRGVILQPAARRAWLSWSSSLAAVGLGWSWGLGWPAQLVPFQASFYSYGWNVPVFEKGWTASTLSSMGVRVERGSLVFLYPLFNPFLAPMPCPPFSKASSFCFLIAFSSLKSLPLAYQKLWLSRVLFLMWDQELILEAKQLNTDYYFLSGFQLFPFSFRFSGSCTRTRRKAKHRPLYFKKLSCHGIWNKAWNTAQMQRVLSVIWFITIWIRSKYTVQQHHICSYCCVTNLGGLFHLINQNAAH